MKECKCTMRENMVGDGCDVCNTTWAIDQLYTPVEMSDELVDGGFPIGLAETISAEVYQPLLNYIKILSAKIDRLERI